MKGPTPPRLQLELVCAKLLLPGAHDDELSLAARLDRIERRMTIAGTAERSRDAAAPAPSNRPAPRRTAPRKQRRATAEPSCSAATFSRIRHPLPGGRSRCGPKRGQAPGPAPEQLRCATRVAGGTRRCTSCAGCGRTCSRTVKAKRRVTWMLLLREVGRARRRRQAAPDRAARRQARLKAFTQGGHDEIVRQALIDVVGLDLMVVAVLDPSRCRESASRPRHLPSRQPPQDRPAPPPGTRRPKPGPQRQPIDGPVVGKERAARRSDDDEVALDDADADDDGLAGPS